MSKPSDLVQGTMDTLLKLLALEPMNGFAVSQRLKQLSGDVSQVNHGSLPPGFAQPRTRRLDHSRAENIRIWPAGKILFADNARTPAAGKRSGELRQAFEPYFASD